MKNTIIEKIINDLPIASLRGEITKEEWKGWFEEVFEKGYSQGYSDATKEACKEIRENYQPNH